MVKPFAYKIPTLVVRHGHRLLDVIHGVQMGDVILKTLAFITLNVGQNPIDLKLFVE